MTLQNRLAAEANPMGCSSAGKILFEKIFDRDCQKSDIFPVN